MKLSKANEDTLKGLAKLLKAIKDTNGDEAVKLFHQDAKALEKDLRQLRASIKDMPEATLEQAPESAPLPEILNGNMIVEGSVSAAPNYEPLIYVNPDQLATGSNLIAIRRQEEGVFTKALYQKT